MRVLYDSLSEKDRRRYAAVEAEKLGHGGVQYIARLFDCDEETIRQGSHDVEQLPSDAAAGRVRKKGGRKPASLSQPELLPALEALVSEHTAGSPMNEAKRWTNRSPAELAEQLQADGFTIGDDTVRRLLVDDLQLSVRSARKEEASSRYPFRNEQFEHIARRRRWYERCRWPILSIDTKKKELLGNFHRPGGAYTDGYVRVLDHDFCTLGVGRLVPYGVYDVQEDEGFLQLSPGPDTSELACDAIWRWWQQDWGNSSGSRARPCCCCAIVAAAMASAGSVQGGL